MSLICAFYYAHFPPTCVALTE